MKVWKERVSLTAQANQSNVSQSPTGRSDALVTLSQCTHKVIGCNKNAIDLKYGTRPLKPPLKAQPPRLIAAAQDQTRYDVAFFTKSMGAGWPLSDQLHPRRTILPPHHHQSHNGLYIDRWQS